VSGPIAQSLQVTLLVEPQKCLAGCLVGRDGGYLEFDLEEPIAAGTLVKLEWDDSLMLGEALGCGRVPGGFRIRVEVEHALYDTPSVVRLAKRILEARQL